jgi:hypothetical protein
MSFRAPMMMVSTCAFPLGASVVNSDVNWCYLWRRRETSYRGRLCDTTKSPVYG